MAQLTDQVIDIIAKPPDRRDESELETVIFWLRRKAPTLKNTTKSKLLEIVKKCHLETVSTEEVIIRQGDYGDSMYIVLRGGALVFIDSTLTGEEEPLLSSPVQSPSASPDIKKKLRNVDKSIHGRYIMKYDVGKSFGEAALLQDEKSRNATVVAESDCDLLVIDQALFDIALKTEQELEYQQICQFVEHHPFFSHMSPKFKRLLDLSLRKETFPFDSIIIKQGDPASALYFLLVGQANIFVEPGAYQKQYPQMWPFEAGIDFYSREFEWLRNSRKNAILRKYEDPSVWSTKSEHLNKKRTKGYAAIEKMVQEKSLCLCSVHEGEVIGDTELILKLGTFIATVTCTAVTTVFVLDFKNLERLVGKKNPLTMETIKESAKEKLAMRANSRFGKDIPFLSYILNKINEERLPSAKKLPPIKPSKQLPSKDYQVQHLLERFKQGHAQLIEPCVPGALIYIAQMREKARVRANIRRRDTRDVNAMLRETRRKMNRRNPRSRREIIDSLKEMMEYELLTVHRSEDEKKHKNKTSQTGTSLRPMKKKKTTPDLLKSPRKSESSALRKSTTPDAPSPRHRRLNDPKNTHALPNNPKLTSSEDGLSGWREKPRESLIRDKHHATISLPVITEAREHSLLTSSRELSSVQKTDRALSDAPDAVSSTSSKREYQRKEVIATSKSPTRLPPLAKPELKKPENANLTKWESALRFVNDRINDRFTKRLLQRGGQFDDYETSELSLHLLENRIKTFFTKHNLERPKYGDSHQADLKLPPLRRYKMDVENTAVNLPKAGGRVWIKKRLCRFANSTKKVIDHDHVRYHMVEELPQFDEVRTQRIIMHNLMSGALRPPQMNNPSCKTPALWIE